MRYFLIFFFYVGLFGSTLHLATAANPSRLNPLLATDSSSSEIAGFLFNGLVKYDKDSADIICDLASDFYYKNDTTLIFRLRKDVLWHDGKPFSAYDVLFTYETLISDKVSSPYSSGFRFVEKVEVLDPHTLQVTYKHPYFKALETWMMGIVPRHILQNEANLMNSTFNTKPIGTGPYKLQTLEHSKNIVLVANEEYFEGKPKIERISFHVIADPMTRFLMLKSGEIDIGSLEPMQYERQLDQTFLRSLTCMKRSAAPIPIWGLICALKNFKIRACAAHSLWRLTGRSL
jgi:ABC-type dipeptide transport system, periplasmic component